MLSPVRRLILCKADGSRPIPRLVGSTTVLPPYSTKFELFDRGFGIEQPAIVTIEKRVHPQIANHRNVERPFGDGDLRAAARTLPPAQGVEQNMLVHERDAHRLDRNGAQHRPHRSRMHADRRLRHVARLPSSASPSTRPEQAEVEPDRDENDEPLDDRRYERRHMIEDQAVADHCDS